MPGERSLQGWVPPVGEGLDVADVIDLAFDYRGDVTVVGLDGAERVGYVCNRDREAGEPYLQLLDPDGGSLTLCYREVRAIRFTGKDMAAGQSYEAWLRRKEAAAGSP